MGRLILPKLEERETVKGAWFELHHAAADFQHLVGQMVYLRWHDLADVMTRVWSAARDVYLSEAAEKSLAEGLIHPTRLDRWRLVTSLESLAGARPNDDVIVMLREPVKVVESPEEGEPASLYINREPVQITGRYYALVKFLGPVQADGDLFRVVHFNRASRQFDGPEEVVRLPETLIDTNHIYRSTSHGIERRKWCISVSPVVTKVKVLHRAPDCINSSASSASGFSMKELTATAAPRHRAAGVIQP